MTGGANVIAYLRVSTADQADSGAGLDAQRAAIEEHCRKREWQVVHWAEDQASGKSMSGRPALADAIERVEQGEASALVVAKLDRLARSVHDFTGLVARSQKQGWALVVLDMELDMTQPAGKLMANILASFAEFERDLIGKRTREALAVRKSQGVRLGRRRDVADSLVDQMVAARDEGWTYQRIADQFNAEGTRTARGGSRWYASTVRSAIQAQARESG